MKEIRKRVDTVASGDLEVTADGWEINIQIDVRQLVMTTL
jgi:hypothetical protein